MSKKILVTDEVKEYLKANHSTTTAKNMSIECELSISTISKCLRELGLKPLNSNKKLNHLKETIIKENYQKMGWYQLSEMVDLSVPFLKKYVELNCEPESNEIKMKNYSFDDGNGNFDVDLFASVCY